MAAAIVEHMPPDAWSRTIKIVEELFAPVTATTGGVGRLISAKFDSLVEFERVNMAKVVAAMKEAIGERPILPAERLNPKVMIGLIEGASRETSPELQELWANLIATELTSGEDLSYYLNILKSLSPEDAKTLQEINQTTQEVLDAFPQVIHRKTIRTASPEHPYEWHAPSHALFCHRLIQCPDGKWVLTAAGRDFLKAVSRDPHAVAADRQPPTS